MLPTPFRTLPHLVRTPRCLGLALIISAIVLLANRPTAVAAASSANVPPFRSWGFAEGNSRHEFATYFALMMLTDQPASVMVYFDRDDGIRWVQRLGVPPQARLSSSASDIVGSQSIGAGFIGHQNILGERTFYFPGWSAFPVVGAGVGRP
jgi:hypothetical protein